MKLIFGSLYFVAGIVTVLYAFGNQGEPITVVFCGGATIGMGWLWIAEELFS